MSDTRHSKKIALRIGNVGLQIKQGGPKCSRSGHYTDRQSLSMHKYSKTLFAQKKKKRLLTLEQAPMKSSYHPYTEEMWKLCGIAMTRIDSLASSESYLCRARRGWMLQMLRHIETAGSSPPFPKLLSFYAAWLLLGIHFVIFPEAIDQDVVACFVSL
ncbi:hypothetical protein IscW_ISCW011106 [Ixodes scapularis]|uniref:Uncharacterized protein n=1 Tax=Ixodes scapularis TaxID=6945 RepID=B7Q6V7_IXOSC|nr:hypothetical protein IscW_ISCW011106 [Ixodes scapularis]|eukprot:XP_002412038.1 hypothetical protein IscW_ISCW011106 [Ixodes scapularis]